MREKRFSVWGIILAAVVTAVLTAAVILGAFWVVLGRAGLGMAQAVARINTSFVGEHDMDKAVDSAMDTLTTNLGDRWSYYMDAESYAYQKQAKKNAYVGIGATIAYPEGEGLLVETVAEGGPAEQAGLLAGDLILAVDGTAMTEEGRLQGWQLTRGSAGTEVVLTVRRADGSEKAFTVVRGVVNEHPVRAELLSDGTGVVSIGNFNNRCADESIAAVDDLMSRGAERLVFDVRNNGGGYLSELTKLLDYLLPEGTIFRSQDKAGHESAVQSDENCVRLPMAVLVNGDTYSAAEFFAAELQEREWGIIVGTPTFGKGFSQQTFPLVSGGAINISTAKYFTGEGVSLIGTGLTLDRELALSEEQAGQLKSHGLPPEEDPQMQAAIEMIS